MQDSNFNEDKYTIDELLRRSWEFKNSEEFANFFNFIARFQYYSRFSTLLVYIQNPGVTFFGSATYWRKKFSRYVKKDAKPHIILVPNGPVMMVYDIFDTEGEVTAKQFLERGLGRDPNKVIGIFSSNDFRKIVSEVKKWEIDVVHKPLSYFTGGYIKNLSEGNLVICLKESLSAAEWFSVLIHELAHLFLGHVGTVELKNNRNTKKILINYRDIDSNTKELEAETISFLICKKLGLETRSAEYIAANIKSKDELAQFSYEMVIKTADRLEKLFISTRS